ncbi:hydantoinase/oxoprolinase family protein [Martelella sp. HB161492]|uniref:hydantoinase/oxoprolinase family protein n=1 Tax=Martelella sp. HB161492 TaxID=2720726 RepID=UPI001591D2CC|nr:hydantoinase/oxoprolinase family protein [Martelella sp. HB161492]
MTAKARLAVDIGGTFTDLALEAGGERVTTKVLTTPRAPEEGVLTGIGQILTKAGIPASDLSIIIHGTTLATNAIIERKGAKTAMLVTEGFRDSIEMAYENRFEQYDIMMDRPPSLVPRHLRYGIRGRIAAGGREIEALDEAAIRTVCASLREEEVGAVAICFLHSYANSGHEERARDIIAEELPDISITLSSEVCPEIREYERWSTATANAYIQPVMASYLSRLVIALSQMGADCPFFMITSAGGLTDVDLARRFPIRLVESGPAGGAILAAHVASECAFDDIVSFDMGGTTAKICLIEDSQPHYSRSFEVARQYRFLKGSGLPIRIPVIDMVEIGAGGGSVARVDEMARIQIGPDSMGSEPGPASYDRGGDMATVTDGNVVLGRIDPDHFAGGTIPMNKAKAEAAIMAHVGDPLDLELFDAALGISEVVEENMANASRVHAVELGRDLKGRTMIAFGGAAPLHAARLAEKLGISRVVIPASAGVGSAVGFLLAPIAFEIAQSRYTSLDTRFDVAAINALRETLYEKAHAIVAPGAGDQPLVATWTADMRYAGQGHEITVDIPETPFDDAAAETLEALFIKAYVEKFGRSIPGLSVEVSGWSLRLATAMKPAEKAAFSTNPVLLAPQKTRQVADPLSNSMVEAGVYERAALTPDVVVDGPAIIVEDETTTVVTARYRAQVNSLGHIILERKDV